VRAQAAGAVAAAEAKDALVEPVKRKCGRPKKVSQAEVPDVQILEEEKVETETDELDNDGIPATFR
jgi:hypothetical protein